MPNSNYQDIYQDIQQLQQIINQMDNIFRLNNDIHQHTAKLGKMSKNFLALDAKHKLTLAQSFEATINEILGFQHDYPGLATAINTIKQANGKIEPETQLNVSDLLCKTWDLAKNSHQEFLVLYNLMLNQQDGGGCLAGISARLIQPYTNLTLAALEDKSQQLMCNAMLTPAYQGHKEQAFEQRRTEFSASLDDSSMTEADQLAIAKALSLSM
jgi:hypothetical protein